MSRPLLAPPLASTVDTRAERFAQNLRALQDVYDTYKNKKQELSENKKDISLLSNHQHLHYATQVFGLGATA